MNVLVILATNFMKMVEHGPRTETPVNPKELI